MSNFSQFLPCVSKAGDTMTGPLAQAAGTAALPSYTFSGDTNTGMWSPGADILAWSTGGSERVRIDASGNVLVTGSGGLGYGIGSGGSVTQATSKSTTVALNKPSGRITTAADALGAGAQIGFTCTNSSVGATDLIVTAVIGGGDPGNYEVRGVASSGSVGFILKNTSTGSLSDAVIIQFAIVKGAAS